MKNHFPAQRTSLPLGEGATPPALGLLLVILILILLPILPAEGKEQD
jgi:hypothetical protein